MQLYTIGHSNRELSDFLTLLAAFEIKQLVDVRTIPKSRHVPWSNQNSLQKILQEQNIIYLHMKNLGGMRHPHNDSINKGWKNAGFRGFADYMQTAEFFTALKSLNELIKTKNRVAIMCAEALPWRCHRSLIADAETIRGITVLHIMTPTSLLQHELTPFAVVDKSTKPIKVFYPKK